MSESYWSVQTKLGNRDSRKVQHNTYLQRRPDGDIALRYHNTDILTWHPDNTVTYQTNGWRTATTKTRMSAWGPLRIWQKNFEWYYDQYCDQDERLVYETFAYRDGMTVPARSAGVGVFAS